MTTPTLRPLAATDTEALYAITLATGHDGGDAAHLYQDPRLMGHIYAGPYAAFAAETCFVAEDTDGLAGFVLGAADTRAFEARLEADWWPRLRAKYADPTGDPAAWSADQRRRHMIHHPRCAPEAVVREYPAHLHLNLLARLRGRGIGRHLLETWLGYAREMGVTAVHAGVAVHNDRAQGFWTSRGFREIARTRDAGSNGTIWMGRAIGDQVPRKMTMP